ncbi:MAG TPA: LPS export ABC transporter permease LptF [Caulobacteraceae bacterium]|jgi:lipopolysaccharide export system permease protein|nr:LPS export ABC transporter permease LptF [Caulobacteraceae bacterium]
MRLIQRYLFRQLLGHTLVATAALTGVAVLTASLSALDILVNDRQSPVIFAEITLLATPQIIGMILPLAVCVAGLVGLNRLHTEQEIVICFAGGMSRWRVAAPAIRLAAFVTVAHLVINLWIQPLCFREMRTVLEAVKADIATTMIRPGEFTHPSPGLTVFAQSMDENGEIRNLFIDKVNGRGASSTTYMAAEAQIAKRDGIPVMVLHNGSIQQFSKKGDLQVVSFDENVQDLRPFLAIEGPLLYHPSDRYLHELFFPDLRQPWERANLKKLLSEGNQRLSTPLYDLAFMSLALAAVLGGAFSRLGYGARIGAAAAFGVGVRVLGFIANALSDGDVMANILQYSTPLVCFIVCMLIVLRQHPARGPRRAPAPPLRGQPLASPA